MDVMNILDVVFDFSYIMGWNSVSAMVVLVPGKMKLYGTK